MLREQARLQPVQPREALPQRLARRGQQAAFELFQPQGVARQPRLRALRLQARLQMVEPLRQRLQAALLERAELLFQLAQVALHGGRVGHQQLGRRRGRGRAQVGGEVGDGEVDLVAHRAHHRHRAGGHGARDRLVVEGHQVLQRAAAAGQQQRVVAAAGGGLAQHRHDRRRRLAALHRHRQHLHLHQRPAPRQHAQHVAHRGAGGRGDHAEAAHVAGQGTLARGIEQALGVEPGLQLLELPAQRALAGRLHVLGHQLELAAWLVQADAGAHQHLHAVGGPEAQPAAPGLEHRAAHLRGAVLQGEVQVPRGRPRDVGQLALHPHQRQRVLQQPTHQPVERAGGEDVARGRVVAGRLHGPSSLARAAWRTSACRCL